MGVRTALVAVAPLAWLAALLAYGIQATAWILTTSVGWIAVLLALPPLVGELAFTRMFEVAARGWCRAVRIGLAGRLLFTASVAYLFVIFPLLARDSTSLWLAQDLRAAPLFLRIVWLSSPVPSIALGLACGLAYGIWTVRRRQGRLTTTAVLPGLATLALFVLMYQFPDAPIRGIGRSRPDFVTRVWAPASPDHRFPREVMVTADERQAIATFGSTFPFDDSDLAPNDLQLDPRRCGPTAGDPRECRRNLALIDLASGGIQTWTMPMTRRFSSEAGDRFFFVPWNISELLELTLDGIVRKHPLPTSIEGGRLREINHTYFAADPGRVYMTHGNNPVLLVWDVDRGELTHVLRLAGTNGFRPGDSTLTMTRSSTRGRVYVSVKSDPHAIVEIDETDVRPLRTIRPAPDAYALELSPDERSLYAASYLSGEIWRFDTETLAAEATFAAPIQCRRIAFSPDGRQLFAASYLTGELAVYDTETNELRDSFYVAPRLEGMHVAGAGLYLLSAEGLYRIPLDVLKRRAERAPGPTPAPRS